MVGPSSQVGVSRISFLAVQLILLGILLAVVTALAEPLVTVQAAASAPGYQYFDYSRQDWGANPRFDSRLELRVSADAKPFQVASFEQDTGQTFHPTIQGGQVISLPDLEQTPTGIAIHDTATPNTTDCSVENSARTLRSIQQYHALEDFYHIRWGPNNPDPRQELSNRGLLDATFGDIGYHFLIDCAGHVFEGRAGGIFRTGRHVHRHNRGQIGIALLGSFTDRQPTPSQRAALVRLVTRLSRDFSIDPFGQWKQLRLDGTLETLTKNNKPVLNIAGHVDFPDNDHTDPGLLDLTRLRQEVAARLTSQEDALTFGETGQTLAEPFRSYWETNGGLPLFGFPISPLRAEVSPEDGKTYQVQYFERARFELHPELVGTPYYILLGRLGVQAAVSARQRYPLPFQPLLPSPSPSESSGSSGKAGQATYFSETGHFLKGAFLNYWTASGGLAIFGLPLCEEFEEDNGQGQTYLVQYFERARFEFHSEAPPSYRVLLGLLGRAAYTPA